jgi:hypothetical protein
VKHLREYSFVQLTKPFGDLPVGAVGTILVVHLKTRSYIVEFFRPVSAVETVEFNSVKLATNRAMRRKKPVIVEYEDMADEGRRIVDAGDQIGGTFPSGLTNEELGAWIDRQFLTPDSDD